MPVNENRIIYLAFLLTLILHLGLIAPLSHWLDRTLIPSFSGESLEIDINEIRSNPQPPIKKQRPDEKVPENRPDKKKKLQPWRPANIEEPEKRDFNPLLREKEESLSTPKEKKQLSLQATEAPKISAYRKQRQPPLEKQAQKKVKKSIPIRPREPVSIGIKKTDETRQLPSIVEKKILSQEDPGDSEPVSSPLFVNKNKMTQTTEKEESGPPDEIKESLRNGKPEETFSENLQYSMNSYQWTFDRFINNWVVDIQKWWKLPIDYRMGKMPEGGDLWVQVHLGRSGRLLSYKVVRSGVTPEMELKAIQALIGSLKRPELPPSFSESQLVINWRFIYPPLRPPMQMRR